MTMANVGGHTIVDLLNILTDVGGVITSGHASHQLIARVLSVTAASKLAGSVESAHFTFQPNFL